ncbi:MAG: hypothetical protein KO318_07210 [Methanobacterium sp.]|uniref:hypothetical protein n=1 Tax=Methanobacterium TaxID=2160 RepID=UPI0012FD85EB|nr:MULTISPECIES: hypothetical protein [Methanobacterium]MBW4257906.1 hypothetical protein [Methanobacterium sp. YSL]MCC7560200.1 hypothetical protein [Methanobacterium sp.]
MGPITALRHATKPPTEEFRIDPKNATAPGLLLISRTITVLEAGSEYIFTKVVAMLKNINTGNKKRPGKIKRSLRRIKRTSVQVPEKFPILTFILHHSLTIFFPVYSSL